jgi:LmbE family N-acetylglucosaminyl deacetylase
VSGPREEPPGVDLGRVLALSPHYDDAVLSCAHLVVAAAQAMVVTVFGGRPLQYPPTTNAWDAECGFGPGDDVVAGRRAENGRAVKALGARDEVCEFLDGQYRGRRNYRIEELSAALQPRLERFAPTTVVLPLGMGHRDHRLTCAAALALRRGREELTWLAYAEYPYAWREEDWEAKRIGRLRHDGYRLTPVLGVPVSAEPKEAALGEYASQLGGLGLVGHLERVAAAPEHLWRISDRPSLPIRARRRATYEIGRRRRGPASPTR